MMEKGESGSMEDKAGMKGPGYEGGAVPAPGPGPAYGAGPGPGCGPGPGPGYMEPEFEQVHIVDYINVLLKKRWLIVAGVFLCVFLTGIVSKRLPKVFTATAKFLPSRNPDMVARMGTLAGPGGKIETLEENVTSDYYVELLRSATFLEKILEKKFESKKLGGPIGLAEYHKVKGASEQEVKAKALRAVGGNLAVSAGRATSTGRAPVVTISYSTYEPELSAAIVNAMLDELIVFNQDIRDSKARQNRIFIENQLKENLELLRTAEAGLADFTARNKKIVTPDLEVERDRLKRAVTVQEEVYITLKKQLELAKIEEQERKPAIEIIDRAAPPLYKSRPKTMKNVVMAFFVSFIFFAGLAFILEWLGKMNPEEERNREFLGHIKAIKRELTGFTRLFKKH